MKHTLLLSFFLFSMFFINLTTEIYYEQTTSTVFDTQFESGAIEYPQQSRLFKALGMDWIFFWREYWIGYWEHRFCYVSSIDGGETWNTPNEFMGHLTKTSSETDVNWNSSHFAVVSTSVSGMQYRLGVPHTNRSITWVGGSSYWDTISLSNESSMPQIEVDTSGYSWIAYREFETPNQVTKIIKNDWKNGSWDTASGYPHIFENNCGFDLLSLPSNEMYFLRCGSSKFYGSLWDGTSWGSNETVLNYDDPEDPPYWYGTYTWSAMKIVNDVVVVSEVYPNADWEDTHFVFRQRSYESASWGTVSDVTSSETDFGNSAPVVTYLSDTNTFFVFWTLNDKVFYRKGHPNDGWGTSNITAFDGSDDYAYTEIGGFSESNRVAFIVNAKDGILTFSSFEAVYPTIPTETREAIFRDVWLAWGLISLLPLTFSLMFIVGLLTMDREEWSNIDFLAVISLSIIILIIIYIAIILINAFSIII